MKGFFRENKYFLIIVLVYLLAEIIVHPLGNYPLNDDWSYAKSVIIFLDTHRVEIGEWPAMTLATHILWGSFFAKILGFSFVSLRISTWVSVLIGTFTLFRLSIRLGGSPQASFWLCLTLLFNPIYFNVSNTFMTDVNFLTLLLLGCYLAHIFFSTHNLAAFAALLPVSIMLTLLRQYGVILPGTLLLCTLFMQGRWKYFVASLLMLVIVYGCLLYYESYLKTTLSPYAAYKFSGNINPTRRLFWDTLHDGFINRYRIVLIHMFFHTIIFTIAFAPAVFREAGVKLSITITLIVTGLVLWQYKGYPLQVGNVFQDAAVGVDTSYETLLGTYENFPHFYHAGYELFLDVLKMIYISAGISIFLLALFLRLRKKSRRETARSFFVLLLLTYMVMILITESFFDRYQIPVIALSLLLFASLFRDHKVDMRLPLIPFFIVFYISTFGTRDYFTWNDRKWEAYNDLRYKDKIPPDSIHGGFEIYSWQDGKPAQWYDYSHIENVSYMIQFRKEPGFEMYRELPFQRFLPFMKDTLRVFRRKHLQVDSVEVHASGTAN